MVPIGWAAETEGVVGRRAYDLLYRRGAPWEGAPRAELVHLVSSGRLTPRSLPPGRALDLGCGSGANAIFLAKHGFAVTGVDHSPVALRKAEEAAAESGPGPVPTFLLGDVTGPLPDLQGRFDLVVDYGLLDDLHKAGREAVARLVARVTRPGGVFLLWCFYDEVVWWRRPGARFPGLKPGTESELFGEGFSIERLKEPAPGTGFACFVMTRR